MVQGVRSRGLETARRALLTRAIAEGKAWKKPKYAKDGSGIVGHAWTTICDPATWNLGRLVFNGKPVTVEPLTVIEQQFKCSRATTP